MKLESAFISHVGCIRRENQDSYADLSHKSVFAIADGMGGHKDGALASSLAVKSFSYSADHETSNTVSYIKGAHELLVKSTFERSKTMLLDNCMGTTGVVLYIDDSQEKYQVSWCGDSRLYHYKSSENRLIQVTFDHSLVQEMVRRGEISEEEALCHRQKNIITSAIGVGGINELKIDTKRGNVSGGDIMILCTDGLSNEISDDEIENTIIEMKCESSQDIVESLLVKSLDNGGRDNITVAVIKVIDDLDLF